MNNVELLFFCKSLRIRDYLMNQTHYIASDVNAMHQCGRKIASQIEIPSVIYLVGALGAGKTTLVKGIADSFDYNGVVSSPTYNLIHEYSCENVIIAHLDLYRIESPDELHMLGLADLMTEKSLLLIEWPEKGSGSIPEADCVIKIKHSDSLENQHKGRNIEVLCQ